MKPSLDRASQAVIDSGSMDYAVQKWVGQMPKIQGTDARVIRILEVFLPFALLVAVVIFSLILLLLEYLHKHTKKDYGQGRDLGLKC